MKNANGSGSVYKLSGSRRKPYTAVVTLGYTEDGKAIRKYIGYFESGQLATIALTDYYKDPNSIKVETLKEIYDKWSKTRFSKVTTKTKQMYQVAWNRLSKLEKMNIKDIKTYHIQNIIDSNIDLSRSALKHIKSLALQLFDYSIENDITNKNYASYVELPKKIKREKEIFSQNDVKVLWDNKNIPWVDSILFMIYTGHRVGEMLTIQKFKIDMTENIIRHGNKTEAGKNKITPINPKILPFVEKRIKDNSQFLFSRNNNKVTTDYYRKYIYYPILENLGLPRLTPQSCRHTFATMLNKVVENKLTISKLMGHTDYSITANVYTHAEINILKDAMNLL